MVTNQIVADTTENDQSCNLSAFANGVVRIPPLLIWIEIVHFSMLLIVSRPSDSSRG